MNPASARKHSDSRLETRQSRAKTLNASPNATDSLLSGHNTSASTTRKRKIDSCESVTTVVVSTLDADSSGGDGNGSTTSIHQSTQAKFSKHDELTSQQLAVGSPSSSSSSSQDDYTLMNALMMSADDDYNTCCCGACSLPGSGAAPYQTHHRYFGEGLGDQRTRCPGIHRYEVYISDSNTLGQQQSQIHPHQAKPSNSSLTNLSTHPYLAPFMNSNKFTINSADFFSSVFGGNGIGKTGKPGSVIPPLSAQSNFLASGNAFWKNQKVTVRRFAFECELGDKWIENPNRRSCNVFKAMNKNVTGINQVMDKLDLQGVKLTNVLSSGKFSHVFIGQLFTFRHKVAVKIHETKLRCHLLKTLSSSANTQRITTTNFRSASQQMTKIFNASQPYPKPEALPEEIALHKMLRHRNVIQLLYVEQIDQHYVSLLELCDHGNLQQLLRASPGSVLAEPICRRYFRDMLEGVSYLHSQNIVHRDIRCENFLVDSHDCVKICDLSCATRFCNGDELQTLSYGNAAYLSPEIIEKKPFNPRTADVWALGVCLHVLLTSKLPFTASICLTIPTSATTTATLAGSSGPNSYTPISPIHTSVSANAAIAGNNQLNANTVNVANSATAATAVAGNRNSGGGNLQPVVSNDGANQNNNPSPVSSGSGSNVPPSASSSGMITDDVLNGPTTTSSSLNILDMAGSYSGTTTGNGPSQSQAGSVGLKANQIAPPQLDQVEIDPLTLMKRGVDLKVVAPSIILSAEATELLKGLLHYVIKVRYSLNRARSSPWMKQQTEENPENAKPYIGNHYMVSNHMKYSSSRKEKELKEAFEI